MEQQNLPQVKIKSFPDLIVRLNKDGTYLELVESGAGPLFVPEEAVIGHNIREVLPPDVHQISIDGIQTALQTQHMEIIQYSLPAQSGEQYFESRIFPITADEVICFIRDISEQVHEKEHIILTESMLEAVVEISQHLTGILHPDELMNAAVRQICQRLPFRSAALYLINRRKKSYLRRAFAPAQEKVDSFPASIQLNQPNSLISEAGQTQTPLLKSGPEGSQAAHPLGGRDNVMGILYLESDTPLTAKNPAINVLHPLAELLTTAINNARLFQKQALIQDKLRLQANILRNISDAIIVADEEFRIQDWNAGAERMYGWTAVEALGKRFPALVAPRFAPGEQEKIIKTIFETGNWYGAARHHRRDGSTFPLLASVSAVLDNDNQRIGFVAINRDITDQQRVEQALQERTAELEARNAELAQFVSAASHDLRAPLRTISGFAALLENEHISEADKAEFQTEIVAGVARMDALITDLLSYTRASRQELTIMDTDLNQVVDMVMRDLQLDIEEAGAQIELAPLPTIQADPVQMRQLYQNLLANALKFRREETVKIQIGQRKTAEGTQLFVRDNGIGIAPDNLQRIFDMFQRLHSSEKYPGTGIGLAICKKIIDRHNGRIDVDSALGKGTEFRFYLV
jgi:PAS domain S-box-containing protein